MNDRSTRSNLSIWSRIISLGPGGMFTSLRALKRVSGRYKTLAYINKRKGCYKWTKIQKLSLNQYFCSYGFLFASSEIKGMGGGGGQEYVVVINKSTG